MKESPSLYRLGALVAQTVAPQDVPADAWPEIVQSAYAHGLGPMLLWVVKQNAPDLVRDPLWTPIVAEARAAAIHFVALEAAQKEVNSALAQAQIPALWLKGITLAHTIYPQPVLRPMHDLDVLVPYEGRQNALTVVEGLGYHFYDTNAQLMTPVQALQLNLTHHFHLRGGLADTVILELHFQLLSARNDLLPLDGLAWFWTQQAPVQNSRLFTGLTPEAHLLYLSAHIILQHGEAHSVLRQYFDLHQLVQTKPVDWDRVLEQASVLGWSYAVDRALSIAVRYFGTPVPPPVLAKLEALGGKEPDAVRARRLQGRGARWEAAWMALQEFPIPARVRRVWTIVIPPRSFMRLRYGLRPDQPVWPQYLYRWLDQTREFVWAVWNRATRWRNS